MVAKFECTECGERDPVTDALTCFTDEYSRYCQSCGERRIFEEVDG